MDTDEETWRTVLMNHVHVLGEGVKRTEVGCVMEFLDRCQKLVEDNIDEIREKRRYGDMFLFKMTEIEEKVAAAREYMEDKRIPDSRVIVTEECEGVYLRCGGTADSCLKCEEKAAGIIDAIADF